MIELPAILFSLALFWVVFGSSLLFCVRALRPTSFHLTDALICPFHGGSKDALHTACRSVPPIYDPSPHAEACTSKNETLGMGGVARVDSVALIPSGILGAHDHATESASARARRQGTCVPGLFSKAP